VFDHHRVSARFLWRVLAYAYSTAATQHTASTFAAFAVWTWLFSASARTTLIVSHADPEQAWKMAQHMRAERVLPIHHRTFALGASRSLNRWNASLRRGPDADRVVIRQIGQLWTL